MTAAARHLALIALAACAACVGPAPQAVPTRADEDNLTLEFARFRKSQVHSVDYELAFSFEAGRDEFSGAAALTVELARTDAPLSIDFVGEELRSVRVDGTPITDCVVRTGSFDIPPAHLRKSMRIEIEYR